MSAAIGKVVLLGASGFLGQALERRLREAGSEVHGFSSSTLDLLSPGSFSALDPLLGPETAIMLISGVTPDKGMTVQTMAANIAMATNLAEYLEQHPVRQCVYFSSDAVYGFGDKAVTEDTPVELPNLYALAKYAGERALEAVAGAKGFGLLVLRPTGVFGPGDTHNSYGPNRFVKSIVREGKVTIFGEGEELRDHLYLDDAANLTIALAEAGCSGVFNLVTGQSRSFGSILGDLQEIAAQPFEIVNLARSGAITHREYDAARLRQALPGFRFTPFQTALRMTYEAAAAAR